MRSRIVIGMVLVSLTVAAGCGDDSDSASDVTTTEPASPSPTDGRTTELIGSWHRAQTCAEMLAAFQAAGLAESHVEWLQGDFYGGEPGPTTGDLCAGARGPLEHDHFFTNAGAFGSHNEHSEQVDSGDFEVVDDDTVSFPSHATEFGYDGDLVVDYSIDGDVVAFDVALPAQCRASAPMRMPGLFPRSRPVRGSAATCRSARRQNCRTCALLQGLHREVAMLEREIHRRLRGYVGYGATQA